MGHERGDVPGSGRGGNVNSAPAGTPASEPTVAPDALVGMEQVGQSADPAAQTDPVPGKWRSPSAGETSGDAAPTTADGGNPTP